MARRLGGVAVVLSCLLPGMAQARVYLGVGVPLYVGPPVVVAPPYYAPYYAPPYYAPYYAPPVIYAPPAGSTFNYTPPREPPQNLAPPGGYRPPNGGPANGYNPRGGYSPSGGYTPSMGGAPIGVAPADGAPGEGSCQAGSYVCPLMEDVPPGGDCACPTHDGRRVRGRAG